MKGKIGAKNSFLKKWTIPGLFFLYFRLFNTVDSEQMFDKSLPMTGFEPRISGVGGDRSTNWATTTAQAAFHFYIKSNLSSHPSGFHMGRRWSWSITLNPTARRTPTCERPSPISVNQVRLFWLRYQSKILKNAYSEAIVYSNRQLIPYPSVHFWCVCQQRVFSAVYKWFNFYIYWFQMNRQNIFVTVVKCALTEGWGNEESFSTYTTYHGLFVT